MSRVVFPTWTGPGEGKRGFRRGFVVLSLETRSRVVGEYPTDCRPARDGALSWFHTLLLRRMKS